MPAGGRPAEPRMPISMRRDPGGHQATCHADPPTGPEPAQLPSSTTHRHPPPLAGRQTRPNPSPRRSRARCAGARAGCCGPNSRRATPVALRCTHRVCRQRGTSSRHVATEQVPDTQRRNRTGTRAEPVSSSDRAISPTPPGQQPSQEGPHNLSRHTTFPRTYGRTAPKSHRAGCSVRCKWAGTRAGLALARSRLRAPGVCAAPQVAHQDPLRVGHTRDDRAPCRTAPRTAPESDEAAIRPRRAAPPRRRPLAASHCPRVHWLVEPMPKSPPKTLGTEAQARLLHASRPTGIWSR